MEEVGGIADIDLPLAVSVPVSSVIGLCSGSPNSIPSVVS